MDTIKTRLNHLISNLRLSKNEFAREIGTSSAMISKITTKEINFGIDVYQKIISKYPKLNEKWLLTGVGNMWIDKDSPYSPPISPQLNISDITEQDLITKIYSNINMLEYLYQRIVDVRILQTEKLKIELPGKSFADKEADIMNQFIRVELRTDSKGNTKVARIFDVEDLDGKIKINEQIEKCIIDFNNIFFKEFRILYLGLRKMDDHGEKTK